jgi:Ni/Co efflux regulator RcnB
MKRLILISAAIASLATALPLGGPALAREGGHGRGGPPQHPGGGAHGGPSERQDGRRGDDGGRWSGGPPRYEDRRDRAYPRGEERRSEAPRGRWEEGDRRRYDDDGAYPPPYVRPGPARRGGYLPDVYRGGVVNDYQRYRLRPPPRGYAWVRVGGGFALVSMEDGRIFDMVQ